MDTDTVEPRISEPQSSEYPGYLKCMSLLFHDEIS